MATSPDEGPAPMHDDTFATRHGKRELTAWLDPGEFNTLRAEIAGVLADAEGGMPNGTVLRARRWLTAHTDAYALANPGPSACQQTESNPRIPLIERRRWIRGLTKDRG